MRLSGAHVLVTGASRGIGLEVARGMARRGSRLSLVARGSAQLDEVSAELGAVAVAADLADFDEVSRIVPRATEAHGRVDVLVNNAAAMGMGPVARLDAETLRRTLAIDLVAPAELARAVAGAMADRRAGAIVNVSSLAGEMALRNVAAYGSSKAGLGYLTRTMARELRHTGVRCQLVILGGVDTELLRENQADPVAGPSSERLKSVLTVPSPEVVAEKLIDHVERGRRRTLVMPAAAAPMVALRTLPTALADLLLIGTPRSL